MFPNVSKQNLELKVRTERKGARSWHRPVTQADLRPERQETEQLKVYLSYGVEVQGQL